MCPLKEEKKGISNIYNEFRRPKGANSWTVRREGRCYVKLHGTKSNASEEGGDWYNKSGSRFLASPLLDFKFTRYVYFVCR